MANKNFKVKNGLDIGDSISITDAGVVNGLTTNNLAEGTTNKYYTDERADARVAVGIANLVDSAPTTLDTLNELAAALGDDPNFATTVTTALGNKLNTADFTSTADTWLGTKSTTNLSEGTNLYYTDARVRAVVDNNVDLDVDGSNNVYVKTIRNGTYVLGELQATRNTAFIDPPPNTSEVSGQNGFEAVSSGPDAGGPLGYSSGFTATYYHGETDAGSSISPTFTTRASAGTNAGGGAAVPSATVLGTFNFNGHSGTGFASYVATQNGGGGKQTLNPLQLQGYTTQAFAEGTISLPTTATTQSNLTIAAVASSGSGVFTNTSADVRQYDVVRVTGTLTGPGTMSFPGYVSGNIYYVTAGANPTTTFTLSAVHDGTPIATTAGTTTGLTFTRHRSIITYAAQTFAPFGFGSKVTVAGITPTGYNGTHRAVFGSTTQVGYGNYQTGTTQTVAGTVSIYNVTAGGTGFRVRGFPDSASYNNTNRINFINHNVAACTYRSDSFTWQGGTNTFNYMGLNAAGGTFSCGPITFKNLGATANITGDNLIYNRVFGQFAYSTTITPAAANTAAVFPLGTADDSNIATVGSTSRLIPGAPGKYNLQFSVQTSNSDNGSDHIAYIWLRKNGVDVVGSTGRIYVTKGNASIVGWNYLVSSANTTDYWEIAYAVDNTALTFPFYAATAFAPSTAALITTLTPVGA